VNDENKRGQGREVLPDLFPEIDGFILGLTPEQLKDSSLEDARREENFRFADQLLAGALACGDEAAIELDRLAREEFEARGLPITWKSVRRSKTLFREILPVKVIKTIHQIDDVRRDGEHDYIGRRL
jgi:hypothetical protein